MKENTCILSKITDSQRSTQEVTGRFLFCSGDVYLAKLLVYHEFEYIEIEGISKKKNISIYL